MQLVVQASTPSPPQAFNPWVDGFSLLVERTDLPVFKIYLGKKMPLGPTNLVGQISALNFNVTNLPPNTLHYWQIGSVRDGVTNLSKTFSFTTEQVVLPRLAVLSRAVDHVTAGFDTRIDRFYAIERTDGLETISWNEVLPPIRGTGSPMTVELPINGVGQAFWRLRVGQ